MARFPKGRGHVDRAPSGARHGTRLLGGLDPPAFYELERKAIFKRAWLKLNVGRMEQGTAHSNKGPPHYEPTRRFSLR